MTNVDLQEFRKRRPTVALLLLAVGRETEENHEKSH
jgi:hypothetical protein